MEEEGNQKRERHQMIKKRKPRKASDYDPLKGMYNKKNNRALSKKYNAFLEKHGMKKLNQTRDQK